MPKKSGSARICMDFRPYNEHVLREAFPLPKIDETLAKLAGAKVFSKLDANCRFWQIVLAENSRLSQPSSHHMIDFASTNYHLVSQVHQSIFREG